jgi:beta-1,4-N-acetylglucosaminyltransferase
MIFVTVGTSELPFDRLLRSIDLISIDEAVVVQQGSSSVRPGGASCVEVMSFPDLLTHMREARAVITHAGVGSVMAALSSGKRPLVIPRRRCFGEAVDDHQVDLAHRLAMSELVTLLEDPQELEPLLEAFPERVETPLTVGETALSQDLRAYLASCCATAGSVAP